MGGYDQSLILAKVLGESGYRYVALSRPGYLGTPLKCGRSPEEQADLYAATLDGLDIEKTAVMAVSGGGPSAIHFALRHPKRCWALVLVSTVAGKVSNRLPLSFKLMKVLAHCRFIAEAIKRKNADDPERAARRTITNPVLLARLLKDPQAWALLQELQSSTVDRMTERFAGTENDVEVTCTRTYPLEDIAVPTLIVHGTADPFVPFDHHGKVFAARIPAAELLALEGGEHPAIFTHRDEAQACVTRFLRQHAPCQTGAGPG
jgi:pimeloyl-ACP methyl ester carboxylesterase